MLHRDVVAWTAMISAQTATGDANEALDLFDQMSQGGVAPNRFALAAVLKACSVGSHLEFMCQVHAQVLKLRGLHDPYVGFSLVEAYTCCGEVDIADRALLSLPERNDASWNALLNGYARDGDYRRVMLVFEKLVESGDEISKYTLPTVLKCRMELGLAKSGQAGHALVIKRGLETDSVLNSCLIEMYSRCLSAEDAKLVESSDEISKYTLPTVLKCHMELGLAKSGQAGHALVIKRGLETDSVLNSCLIEMYSRCLSAEDAYGVFARIDEPDVVHCSVMISCFDRHDMAWEAFDLFIQMADMGVKPNQYTFVGIAVVASKTGDVDLCRSVHAHTVKSGFPMLKGVGDIVLHMYVKVGVVQDAMTTFYLMHDADSMTHFLGTHFSLDFIVEATMSKV